MPTLYWSCPQMTPRIAFAAIDVETVDTQVFVKMTEYGIDVHLDVLRPFMANGVLIKTAAELF